jgi:hypothetical protein
LREQLQTIEQHIASLSNIPKEDALNIELKNLSGTLADLASREKKIEAVILESPSRALEMPLLKRDIDSLREFQQSSISALKDGVDRIYDLNKWLLGAMAISIVTLAAVNFLKPKSG